MSMDISTITLSEGGHNGPSEGHCLLEAVSMFAGESFCDRPECVCPVLAAFGRSWRPFMAGHGVCAISRSTAMAG